METLEPKKYAVAFCRIGLLGLITSDSPKLITYNDGHSRMAWTGIQLRHDTATLPSGKRVTVKPGDSWSSQTPRVIGYLDDFYMSEDPE
jgi:hypothetical protein